jgi:hypothetical protein
MLNGFGLLFFALSIFLPIPLLALLVQRRRQAWVLQNSPVHVLWWHQNPADDN